MNRILLAASALALLAGSLTYLFWHLAHIVRLYRWGLATGYATAVGRRNARRALAGGPCRQER